jgi:hypothetical protein
MTKIVRETLKTIPGLARRYFFRRPAKHIKQPVITTVAGLYSIRGDIVLYRWRTGARISGTGCTLPNGKTHRIHKTANPENNPFVSEPNAMKTIYSLGNRKIQEWPSTPKPDNVWVTEHANGRRRTDLIKAGAELRWEPLPTGKN